MSVLSQIATLMPFASALVGGTLLGFLFGLVPGIGGRTGIILALPIAMLFSPIPAAIFLFALHAVVHTGSSIPAIAFGLPSTAADAATVIDGYPLAKMGRAGEALGASLSASAIGGVLGAIAFLVAIPVARPLVLSFAAPEFLVLSLLGITVVGSLSREGFLPGLAVAAVGVILAMVGVTPYAAIPRFTFGILDLWDGVRIPALVCGVFVVPEMLSVDKTPGAEQRLAALSTSVRDVFGGMLMTFRYKALVLRSSLYGILIGLTPAVGSSVAVWLAYGYAARSTKSDVPFGMGAIAGVIAPEAANNSKEGGAMIPTLFFGIPGSSSMAIMLGALGQVGFLAGPSLLTTEVNVSYTLAATVLIANLLAIPAFFLAVPGLVRLSSLRREFIVPIAVVLSVTAALIDAPRLSTLAEIVLATILGLALKRAGWPRAPLILGFVVGRLAEASFHQTAAIWGWSALQRPVTAGLIVVLAGWVVYIAWSRKPSHPTGPRKDSLVVSTALGLFFALATFLASRMPLFDGAAPFAVGIAGVLLSVAIVIGVRRNTVEPERAEPFSFVGLFLVFAFATPLIGLFAASFGFVGTVLWRSGIRPGRAIATAAAFVAVQFAILAAVFDVAIEKEIIGRLAWSILF